MNGAKLINIGQPGMGHYRVDVNGETVGYVTRSKEGTYRCPVTGTEFGLHNCKPFWLATNCQGHTLAVQANRQDALWWVLEGVRR